MLLASGIVPRHPILHLLDKDGESQPDDIAQLLLNPALRKKMAQVCIFLKELKNLAEPDFEYEDRN
jgi:hypothetical protein